MAERIATIQELDGRADFDFFIGSWDVKHRRLTQRLKGCNTWEEFSSVSVARKILGGLGNMDETTMDTLAGRVEGMTVRLFDPQSKQWSIYWADSKSGILQTPMIGRFQNGRGEFYDQETFEGMSIFSRFIWTPISDAMCRWEQAFSADGGRTWETNWIMEFSRREDTSGR